MVDFVADAVSPAMSSALRASWPVDLTLGVHPLEVGYLPPNRRRAWVRRWTLYSHAGDAVAVMLAVAEDHDDVLVVSVDSRLVAELVERGVNS